MQSTKRHKKVQVGNDQEMTQSEGNSHSTNRGVEKIKLHLGTYTNKTYVAAIPQKAGTQLPELN